jgi:2-amino-4-hydroxy-6-hydroxymethyldihydropteridine diphosphokinase
MIYISLGSNLGDRGSNLKKAIEKLELHPQIQIIKRSSILENPAIEEAGPKDFLNQVLALESDLEPEKLLDFLLAIEKELDPERNLRGRKKARYIDLDILSFHDSKIKTERLEIPHPRLNKRGFLLSLIKEIS